MKRPFSSISLRLLLSAAFAVFLTTSFHSIAAAQEADMPAGTRSAIGNDTNDNDAAHNKAASEFWRLRATSGSDKSWDEIERIGYESIRSLGSNVSLKESSIPSWQPVGGSLEGRTSGRLRGIAFDPQNPKIVYVAAAQGGVWKTDDITANSPVWVSLSDKMPTLVMGSVAVDPNNGQILYAGTGEVQGGYSTPGGQGLFKSMDGGLSWNLIASTSVVGSTVGQIVVDPGNSQHVLVATGNGAGLQVSNDGGATWAKAVTNLGDPVSIAMDPTDANKIYVGAQSGGVSRSADGGKTWTKWAAPTGGTGSIGTTIVAIAPSSPNMIYASVANGGNTYGIVLSTDYGVTWKVMNPCNTEPNPQTADQDPKTATSYPHRDYLHTQGYYGNAISVNPQNSSQVIVGGIDVWNSSDSGKSLVHSGYWTANLTDSRYVHADIHGLKYNGNTLYAICDGGVFVSPNGGQSWVSSSNGTVSTFQYVGIDADPAFTYVLGGTQDNGALREGSHENVSHFSRGGDAGILWIADDGQTAYSTYVYADFQKSNDSGKSWLDSPSGTGKNFISNQNLLNEGALFYAPWDVFPDGTTVAYAGNRHIYVSTNGGNDGFPNESSTSLSASVVHVSPADPTIAWAGAGGKVYRCTDLDQNGSHWTAATVTGASGSINGMTSDPGDPTHVWAVSGGGKHFFMSVDGGATWTAPATNFPNLPCNSIARDPSNGNLYVGTDFGVVYSTDQGVTWQTIGANLPLVQVLTIKVKPGADGKHPILLAGTFGRGAYYLDLLTLGVTSTNQPSNAVATLHDIFPNPATQAGSATIGFNLVKGGVTLVTLHDLIGREVKRLAEANMTAGEHTLKLNTSELAAGTYVCAVTTSGVTLTQKIEVIK